MIKRDPHITVEAAIELTGWDRATIFRKLGRAELIGKNADEKSGNGKHATLVQVLSLPTDAQVRYWDKTLKSTTPDKPAVNLAEVPKASLDEALRRHPLVLQTLDIIASRELVSARMEMLAAGADETSRTLYRWADAWKREGMPGLLPKWGKTRGTFTALSTAIQEVIKYEYLSSSRPSVTTVYRRVTEYCAQLALPAPCTGTINRFIKSLPLPAVVMAREGNKAWRAECEPKCRRDWSSYKPGEIYVGDHRLMDVFVRWGDQVKRPWFTAWYDPASKTCVGWHLALAPDSGTIAQSLRRAMLRFGVPRELYVDNGKDYKSHYLNGKTLTHKDVRLSNETIGTLRPGVLNTVGVTIRHAQAYTPWSKPIEPWFGHTFPVWERTLPGWCGSDNKERPEKLAAEIRRGALLTMDEFKERLTARLDEYHQTEHSELGGKPIDQWLNVPIERPEPRAVDILLLRHKPCKVYPDGIRLFGRHYWDDALAMQMGHTVDVRYDDNEIGLLMVYVNNAYLCDAVNQAAMSMGASKQDLRALHQRKALAKRNALSYPEDRRTLMDSEEALRQIAVARRANQVVTLNQDPPPQPGVIVRPPRVASMMARGTARGPLPLPSAAPQKSLPHGRDQAAPCAGHLGDTQALEHDLLHKELMGL